MKKPTLAMCVSNLERAAFESSIAKLRKQVRALEATDTALLPRMVILETRQAVLRSEYDAKEAGDGAEIGRLIARVEKVETRVAVLEADARGVEAAVADANRAGLEEPKPAAKPPERPQQGPFSPEPTGFFATGRTQLEDGLARVGRDLCEYTYDGDNTAMMCRGDCKYGIGSFSAKGQRPASSEQTGCPEVHQALAIIHAMTSAEYSAILARAKGEGPDAPAPSPVAEVPQCRTCPSFRERTWCADCQALRAGAKTGGGRAVNPSPDSSEASATRKDAGPVPPPGSPAERRSGDYYQGKAAAVGPCSITGPHDCDRTAHAKPATGGPTGDPLYWQGRDDGFAHGLRAGRDAERARCLYVVATLRHGPSLCRSEYCAAIDGALAAIDDGKETR